MEIPEIQVIIMTKETLKTANWRKCWGKEIHMCLKRTNETQMKCQEKKQGPEKQNIKEEINDLKIC